MTAAHEPRTREKLRAFLAMSLLPAVAERIEGEERMVRASLIGSQVLGLIMLRYVWRIEPLASASADGTAFSPPSPPARQTGRPKLK